MFTVEAIKAAHSKVKSGADFPNYIKDLKLLGVLKYETFVADGHTNYEGANRYSTSSKPLYDSLNILKGTNKLQFVADLEKHQQGGSDYMQFCNDCANSGINKWITDLNEMTCTYYDLENRPVYTEAIMNS